VIVDTQASLRSDSQLVRTVHYFASLIGK